MAEEGSVERKGDGPGTGVTRLSGGFVWVREKTDGRRTGSGNSSGGFEKRNAYGIGSGKLDKVYTLDVKTSTVRGRISVVIEW